ncbi:MAG: signal peptidase I [Lentisphaerae bacterium]|nr:signal peptidase I [Lentisphaerota bacterium]
MSESSDPVFEKIWRVIRNFFMPKLNRWFFLRLGITIILAVIVFKFLLVPCVISGASMEPTVHSSGFTFCWRGSYWFSEPQRGDIVIIKYDNNIYFLKRIVALPGETVFFRNGKLYVNGKILDEPYVKLNSDWNMTPVKVGSNEYYVVGDNRSMHIAQHQKGAVRSQRILGQMAF